MPEKTPAEHLATPVQFLKGVGPQRAEQLTRMKLHTARDILFGFPRDYQDMNEMVPIDQLEADKLVGVCGTVEEIDMRNTGPGRSMLGVLIRQDNHYLRGLWFNQPYMLKRFTRGQRVVFSGKASQKGGRWEMTHPQVEMLAADQAPPSARVLPVYGLTEGISQYHMRRIVSGVVQSHAQYLDEVFPTAYLEEHGLFGIRQAVEQIHEPDNRDRLDEARYRFVYQELLVLQLALAIRKSLLTRDCRSTPLEVDAQVDARVRRLLPFKLTAGQERAVEEIAADMAQGFPMNRLLQGDVGSGKTVVAVYAMMLAIARGQQAALMAPTEVLAQQHFGTLEKILSESRVRLGLLTGSLSAGDRRDLIAKIEAGEIDILVGTQAIVQSGVEFASLGLVVIDEQHKFGVQQRATLRKAGLDPHYLVMTATPIPRTIAMTLFGDLDTSTIKDRPPGRQEVHTYVAGEGQRASWWEFFRKKLHEGRQGFVITPLVEDSGEDGITGVESAFENLANGELEQFRLDLVHGRMPAAEKQEAMDAFRRGDTQVLVATSVVEVGVDVPNATVMTIENAQSFGLAQLHQLRGRVGRGQFGGFVCAFADLEKPNAEKRLQAFSESSDGFHLAEVDLQLRGPGELLGTRQHGLPPLRMADLLDDSAVAETARADAIELVQDMEQLRSEDWRGLMKMVQIRYGKTLELGDVG